MSDNCMCDQNDLPATQREDFVADFNEGKMDLSELYDKTFIVAVSKGDRNSYNILGSTIHGPFTFSEMCESAGSMWEKHMHNPKVFTISKDEEKSPKCLDVGTVDYILAFWKDLVFETVFESQLMEDKTLKPGYITKNEVIPVAEKKDE